MYVVLTGAKKNLGDFLITERCEALLNRFRPEQELVRQPSWKPLDLELVGKADAVIILGGPGYQPQLYPKTYPLTSALTDIPCPVIPLGLGWKGIPGDAQTEREYTFTESSLRALRCMEKRAPALSCRDWLSEEVLHRHGLSKTLMTGCPVWYDLPSIGKKMTLPTEVRRIVFTPAQLEVYSQQSRAVAAVIAKRWPKAEKICAFHRGIGQKDEFTPTADIDNNLALAGDMRALGFDVRDVSGTTDKVRFYGECDFHVGYRVHAHIYFLSVRRPSLLLHEDGRGRGASLALGLEGVDAFRRSALSRVSAAVVPKRLRGAARRITKMYEPDPGVGDQVAMRLRQDEESGFARYAGVGDRIDAQLVVMARFLQSLP